MIDASRTIYIDLDDVLCHAARHFLMIVEREFGKRIAYEQLTDFDVGRSCGLTAAERDELYRLVHRPDELLSMTPVDGAIGVLEQWRKQGFEIAIVTGRPPETIEVSLAWLAKHRITHSSFTVVDKYSRFPPDNKSAISLAELATHRFCWAVEDSLPMAQYLVAQMRLPVALIDCPWNRVDQRHARISRYANWHEISAAGAVAGILHRS
ncbi:MAG TPA: bifunctional metallophosphatase/5'-nucleotidase [Candidatus Binatia bacterium]|jgi:uncharacterized HAD superfamily protein